MRGSRGTLASGTLDRDVKDGSAVILACRDGNYVLAARVLESSFRGAPTRRNVRHQRAVEVDILVPEARARVDFIWRQVRQLGIQNRQLKRVKIGGLTCRLDPRPGSCNHRRAILDR